MDSFDEKIEKLRLEIAALENDLRSKGKWSDDVEPSFTDKMRSMSKEELLKRIIEND